jgi:hypothetical protein
MLEYLRSLLSRLVIPADIRAVLTSRLNESLSLVAAGEPKAALENLCDNLYEFDVPLDADARARLAEMCSKFSVASSRITLLNKLDKSNKRSVKPSE